MSDILEFGLDEPEVVKFNDLEMFKQSANQKKHLVSIISFKKHSDKVLQKKEREAHEEGRPFTDADRAEIIAKVDEKIAEKLGKKVSDLTEVDRLDINSPRFGTTNTHYVDGVGSFRCLSSRTNREICCNKYGDPSQSIATIILSYPTDRQGQLDKELLRQQKYCNFYVWRMTPKKFQQVNQAYSDARSDGKSTINLRVTLDGDEKYQKQKIEVQSSATWATEGFEDTYQWVLDTGYRMFQQMDKSIILGMKLTREKLLEKISGSGGGSAAQITGGDEEKPKQMLSSSYDSLID